MQIFTILFAAAIISLIIWRRTRAMYKPIKGNGLRMLLPMIFMLIGFLGFTNPAVKVSVGEIGLAIAFGIVFAIPMILTTNYEVREDGLIYAQKNKAFLFAIVGLLIIRLVLRNYISGVDQATLGMLFYVLAVAYVLPWRVASYLKFKKTLLIQQNRLAAGPLTDQLSE